MSLYPVGKWGKPVRFFRVLGPQGLAGAFELPWKPKKGPTKSTVLLIGPKGWSGRNCRFRFFEFVVLGFGIRALGICYF